MPPIDGPDRHAAEGVFLPIGEMGRRCREFDWAATPLGPVAEWSPALRTAAGMVVAAATPTVLLWGEQLVQVYNDALIPFQGDRHPRALGRPSREIWPEFWPVNEPLFMRALGGEQARWNGAEYVVPNGDGTVSTVIVDLSFSPVLDGTGSPAGVLVSLVDLTTAEAARTLQAEQERLLERYRLLFESNPQPMWVFDLETLQFLAVNEAAIQKYGYSRDEFLSMTIADIRPPEDVPLLQKSLGRNVTAYEGPRQWRHRRKDGSIFWVEISSHPLEFEGRPAELILSIDVTRQKEASQQLEDQTMQLETAVRSIQKAARAVRTSEARFRALVENAAESVAILDATGNVLYQSPGIRRVLGYGTEELSVISIEEHVYPDDVAMVEQAFADAAANPGMAITLELRARHSDGSWRDLQATFTDLSHDPSVRGIVVNAHDISDRKRAEQRLRDSEARYRSFFVDDLTGDFIARPDGSIIDCNRAFVRMFGFRDEEEARQGNIFSLYPDAEQRKSFITQLRSRGMLELVEFTLARRDGTAVDVIGNIVADRDELGGLAEIKGYLFDITERNALEKQLAQSQKMEVVGRLAGGIAHDFNNLLTVIRGNAQILQQADAGAAPESVDEIDRAAERAADLTRQLLAFSRQQVLLPKVIDLNESLRDMRRMLERLIGENISLVLELAPGAWPVKVDPGQLQQVVMNLVVNARDAMPVGGTIHVRSRNVTATDAERLNLPTRVRSSPEFVELVVIDDGEGMDSATTERIFEPFFTTKEQGKGTGLGLSTVYGIVNQSDGHVWAESRPGQGSTFHVLLPRAAGNVDSQVGRRSALSELPGGTETILVVEDEEGVRTIVALALQARGYHVLRARDGAEALEVCSEFAGRIDLLLTDVVMPGMSGVVLQTRVAALHPHTRVLFMSGYTADAIDLQGIEQNGIPLLQKPFTPGELLLRVREILDQPAVE